MSLQISYSPFLFLVIPSFGLSRFSNFQTKFVLNFRAIPELLHVKLNS